MSKINEAWDYVHGKLFYEKTSMFYDFLTSKDQDGLIRHLPSPELIKRSIPNPCGWSSGMENAVLTGGIALDAAINRYACEKDESIIPIIKRIFKGMRCCAEVSEVPGFLARAVSPVDGVTHYIDSSRDQYTHFVYSSVNYFYSGLASEDEKQAIVKILTAFAERARDNITEENSWNYLREDGGRGVVNCMWKSLSPHEFFRLPMIYLAAYKMTGRDEFFDLYMSVRDEAMVGSEKAVPDPNSPQHSFAFLQMMCSLRLAYYLDEDESFKERNLKLMRKLAQYGREKAILSSQKYSGKECADIFTYMPKAWNELPAYCDIILDGYAYYVHEQFGSFKPGANMARWALTDIGDGVALYCMCPDTGYDGELMAFLERMVDAIDYDNIYTDGPVSLLNGYWFMKCKEKEN